MRCCSLEPFCYCGQLEPEDRDELRTIRYQPRRVRRSTPEEVEDLRVAMTLFAERRRRARRLRFVASAFIVGFIITLVLLAGCDPSDGYVEPSPSEPMPTIMFTVIRPQGGIYDNN